MEEESKLPTFESQDSPPPPEAPDDTRPDISEIPKKSNTNLILIIIIIVLVLGIIGALAFMFLSTSETPEPSPTPATASTPTPSADPTATWETHTNTETYSLKHPPDWVVTEQESQTTISSPDSIVESPNIATSGGELRVVTNTSLAPETQDSFIARRQSTDTAVRENHQKTTFNNFSAVTYTETIPLLEQTTIKVTAVLTPTTTYEISLTTFDSELAEKTTLNQILSTFEFIEESPELTADQDATIPPLIPSNFITYNHNEYSFKYPSELSVNEVHQGYSLILIPDPGTAISFFAYDNPEGLSRREFYADLINSELNEVLPHLNIKEVPLGKNEALRIVQDENRFALQSTPYTNYIISKGSKIYHIQTGEYSGEFNGVSTEAVKQEIDLTVVNQILSTFELSE